MKAFISSENYKVIIDNKIFLYRFELRRPDSAMSRTEDNQQSQSKPGYPRQNCRPAILPDDKTSICRARNAFSLLVRENEHRGCQTYATFFQTGPGTESIIFVHIRP